MKDIHIHIWDKDSTKILKEVNLKHTDTYDDHYQYAGMIDDKWFEIRVPK